MTTLLTDLGLPEAPVLLPDGSWLVVEMASDRGCITRFNGDGTDRSVVAQTGRPNGLALGDRGTVWVAESMQRTILRLTLDGSVTTVASESDGSDLMWPNDLCVGPDQAVYFTDSGTLVTEFLNDGRVVDHWEQLPLHGRVCRLDTASGRVTTLDEGLLFTNGIAFGPDGMLYVNETVTGNVYRYRLREKEVHGSRELFGNVLDSEFVKPGFRGPDGMAFDVEGRLYVTVVGQGDVTILGRDGAPEKRISTEGAFPTNVAFGPRGSKRIYVVEDEHGQMEVFDVGVDGLALPRGA